METAVNGQPPAAKGDHSRARVLLRGASWQLLAQTAPLVVNLVLTPFVIGRLGTVAYGYFVLTSMLTQFLGQFDGGIGRSAQRYFMVYAGADDRVTATRLLVTLLGVVTGMAVLTLGAAFVWAPALMQFFHAPPDLFADSVLLLRVLAVIVGVALARNLFAAVLYSHQRFALTSVTLLVAYVVYAVGTVLVLQAGMGLAGLAYVFIAQQAVGTLSIVPAACRYLSRSGIDFVGKATMREFLGFSIKVQASGLLNVLSFQGVTLIVGRMAPAQLGTFAPGATFAQQLRLLPNNAMVPIQSMLGRAVGAVGPHRAREDAVAVQRMWVTLVCGWVAVGAPATYFGVNNWLPLPDRLAGLVACTLLGAHLFALLQGVLLQWALLLNRPSYEIWAQATNVGLTLILAVPLVRLLGAYGVALAVLAGQIISFGALQWVRAKLPVAIPSVLPMLPYPQLVGAAAVSYASCYGMDRLLAAGFLRHGVLGLLAVAVAALPALVLYITTTVGWGRLRAQLGRPLA